MAKKAAPKKTKKKVATKVVATKKKKPAAKSKAKPASSRKKAVAKPVAKPAAPSRSVVEQLGEITVPSGKLAIFDIGLVGYLPREALEPQLVTCDVPSGRPLAVIGQRVGKGRFAECWDHIAIDLAPGDVYNTKKLGEAGVDFARLVCMDHAALDHWQHDDSLDGKADVVFWGRDEALLAKALRADRVPKEGFGWVGIPVEDAESKVFECEILKAENRWLLNIDFRPHSHHFQALAAARANPLGAGTLEIAGTQMMLMFTSWGDGVFPIYLDLDAEERPLRVRIQLATPASNAAMTAVNL